MLYKLSADRPILEQKKLGPFTFNIEIKKSQPHQAEGLAQARGSSEDYGHLPGYIGPDGDSLDFFVGDRHDGQIYSYKKQQKLNERGERDPKVPWKTTDVKFVVGHGPDEAAKFHAGMTGWTTPTLRYVKDKSFRDWSALERHMNRHYKGDKMKTATEAGFFTGLRDGVGASMFQPISSVKYLVSPEGRYQLGLTAGAPALPAALAALSAYGLYRGGKHLYDKYTTPAPVAEETKLAASISARQRFGLLRAGPRS